MKRAPTYLFLGGLQTMLLLVMTSLSLAQESESPLFESAVEDEVRFNEAAGYENYRKIRQLRLKLIGPFPRGVQWSADGEQVAFTVDGKKKSLNLKEMTISDYEKFEPAKTESTRRVRRRSAGRALQLTSEPSPDGKWVAKFQDNNVWIYPAKKESKKEAEGSKKAESESTDSKSPETSGPNDDAEETNETDAVDSEPRQITTKGTDRLRFGTGCWVYGEELDQGDAMWWSADSQRLAFYEMDEQHMKDYHLTVNNAGLYTDLLTVRYPKAGDDNPKVAIHVHDLETGSTKRLEIPGEPMQYLFNPRFLPNGHELLVSRTNRHQDKLDLLAVDVDSGEIRNVVSETQSTWQNIRPVMRMLEDGERFVWESERNGFKHFELRNLDGELLNPLSKVSNYPCRSIVQMDEESGWFYYSANSAANPYNTQLHRVKLDGTGHQLITTANLNHSMFQISPDHKSVLCRREQFDIPAEMVYYSCDGDDAKVLASTDLNVAEEANLSKPELFKFTAADGVNEIYGTLHKPSNFDPEKKYPLLIDVYGGPESTAFRNSYSPANPICELGFLVAKIGNRGTTGRGKKFESSTYLSLGEEDIQDQADGVKFLRQREYVDGSRVGIYGHSYGGYMSALGVLKYPDVFHVAVAGAPVTSWTNYDSIYTERFMRTPAENSDGYGNGSCMKYAKNLKGRMLLVHGLIDDNVHPSNTWQLAKALQDNDKRFDMMVYPGFKHGVGSTYSSLRWEYFVKHLRPNATDEE